MQFHLNGFRPGDPRVSRRNQQGDVTDKNEPFPENLDVLIVGCGPAGLTLATQLAAFPDIRTRIIDMKPDRLLLGQADGVACRTMEMFEAFGFSERVLTEAYWVNETTFWKPDENRREDIVRSDRIQDTEDGLSEFPHVILNQARVHDFFLDAMWNSPAQLKPDYSHRLLDISRLRSGAGGKVPDGQLESSKYPVQARLERIDSDGNARVDTVHARFVIGCDGARSRVRKCLGHIMYGDFANQAWGVMDILAITDFPDIRLKSLIHSNNEGNLLIIPREGGYLVRLYIELDRLKEEERVSGRDFSIDQLISAARRILQPYTLEVKEVVWWSVYEIGQRLCDRFDDLSAESASERVPHVFIAGDACHTHSPKAGQGMNVSMQDSFNLGWKLASVIRGTCSPQILRTYSNERQEIARELIEFDREFARMFSAPPQDSSGANNEGVDPAEFQKYFVKQARFTAGTATQYRPSLITAKPIHQHLAEGFPIGMRFHSAPVVRLADAKLVELGHTVKADGRWRVFAFSATGDTESTNSGLRNLCEFLAESDTSPVKRYTPSRADVDSVIDVRAVFQHPHRNLAFDAMPLFLRPGKGRYGLCDYEKMYCPDLKNQRDIFDLRKIDRNRGCVVIVRPDQYVAQVLPLEGYAELCEFFNCFMVDRK